MPDVPARLINGDNVALELASVKSLGNHLRHISISPLRRSSRSETNSVVLKNETRD